MRRITLLICLAMLALAAGPALAGQEMTLAVVTKPGSAQTKLADKFAQVASAATGGELSTKVLHSGQAGDETEIVRKVKSGKLDLAIVTLGVLDQFAPEVRVIEYPFLLPDYCAVDRVVGGEPGRKVLASLGDAGLVGLAFGENGFRNLTNNVRPVRTPSDVAGLRIRTMESQVQHRLWSLLGAVATPHPWPINDLLAKGEVDGQENPLWVVWEYELYKVQKHLSMTRHVYSALVAVANPGWLAGLGDKHRQAVREAMDEASYWQRLTNRAEEAGYLGRLMQAGMKVVARPEREAFAAMIAPLAKSPLYSDPDVKALLAVFRQAAQPAQ